MSTNSSLDKKKISHALEALQQEHWYLTKILLLLTIICITSLGSLSLAQHFIPPPPKASNKTSQAPKYREGVCDANPAEMAYISPSSGTPSASLNTPPSKPTVPPTAPAAKPLPDAWYRSGLMDTDFSYAQACAAKFVMMYHTFNASDPKTLERATYMLSAEAQRHFYQGGPDGKANLRMDPTWRTRAEQHQQNQVAQAQEPSFASIISLSSGKFLVSLDVPYRLTKEIDGSAKIDNKYDTVTLQNTDPSPKLPDQGVGWQVTDWKDGDL